MTWVAIAGSTCSSQFFKSFSVCRSVRALCAWEEWLSYRYPFSSLNSILAWRSNQRGDAYAHPPYKSLALLHLLQSLRASHLWLVERPQFEEPPALTWPPVNIVDDYSRGFTCEGLSPSGFQLNSQHSFRFLFSWQQIRSPNVIRILQRFNKKRKTNHLRTIRKRRSLRLKSRKNAALAFPPEAFFVSPRLLKQNLANAPKQKMPCFRTALFWVCGETGIRTLDTL